MTRWATYKEVLGVNVRVLGKVEVLLGHEHTLLEEVLVDLLAVGLGNKPARSESAVMLTYKEDTVDGTYIVASSLRSSGNRTRC